MTTNFPVSSCGWCSFPGAQVVGSCCEGCGEQVVCSVCDDTRVSDGSPCPNCGHFVSDDFWSFDSFELPEEEKAEFDKLEYQYWDNMRGPYGEEI